MSQLTRAKVSEQHRIPADELPHYKQALKLEKGLKAKLDVIIRRIMKEEVKDQNVIFQKYETALKDTIENSVSRAYMLGAQYVNNELKREMKFTHRDIDNMKALSSEFYSRMQWRIQNYVLQRDTNKPALSSDFISDVFAAYVIPRSLHTGTVDKTRQIALAPHSFIPKTAAIKQIERQYIPAGLEPTYLPQQPAVQIAFIWRTAMDDRVCLEYCLPLEGAMFRIDDPHIPAPDSDTHPRCRCVLELIEVI